MTFPDRLKSLRVERGLSQGQLAKEVGVSKNLICGYESGRHDPTSFNLCCLADALHVSMDYLYGRTDRRDVD
ncbi:helix-turn-helix protein [Caprobacter fermentans]|uniref:Helix-turn-helix protein n=1 Tax=Caproicibacter fermentans TaxID=2576756 RepID=A0A6N8HZC6_9FIRM|nr:helix-turn-helix transcriptional regulator [Caproicibacter fermentans]MVB11166.1 helix-turn-helix protein [Caproicibacter fermentans]